MVQTAGITIEHNASGTPIFARIDLRKYGDKLKDFFATEGVSIEKSTYNPEFVKKIKSQEGMPGVKIKASEIWK